MFNGSVNISIFFFFFILFLTLPTYNEIHLSFVSSMYVYVCLHEYIWYIFRSVPIYRDSQRMRSETQLSEIERRYVIVKFLSIILKPNRGYANWSSFTVLVSRNISADSTKEVSAVINSIFR